MTRRWLILIVVVLAAVGGAYWLRNAVLVQSPPVGEWQASGFIEAEEVDIAPEIGGRIAAVLVEEGDEVEQGDVLLRLQDDVLSAQVELARARLQEAEASLALMQAGARPETLDRFAAQVALAQAACDGARQAWLDAQAMRDNPQTLDVQITAARAQVSVAHKQLEAALEQRSLTEIAWKEYGKSVEQLADIPEPFRPAMPPQFYLIPYQWEQALAATEAAQAAYDGAQAALAHLLAQRANPHQAQLQVDAAYARYRSAEAAVARAQAAWQAVKAGATPEQIAAARAQVQAAQAALEAAQVQLDKATVRAPINGIVVARSVYTGEPAVPAIPALTIADLEHVTLTIYMPGKQLGQITLGQSLNVRVDAFADRTFEGIVVYISDQAEFTPRSVRTAEERATLVYAVRLRIANPDHLLKPGMQAEARGR